MIPRAALPATRGALGARIAFACATAGMSASVAHASPWLLQPSVSLSSDWQSNPAFALGSERATTQAGIGLSLPAEWQAGRYSATANANAQLRRARGASDSDTSDVALELALARAGERLTASGRAGYTERNLLGVDAPDVGVERATGAEGTWSAGASVSWRLSEVDAFSVAGDTRRTRYDSGSSALVGSDNTSAQLSYSRALGARLQFLVGVSLTEFAPANDAGRSRSTSAQAGFAYQANELWAVRATLGRSRLKSDFSGLSVPGSVYEVDVSRRTEIGGLTFGASQAFQSSAFGTVVRRRDFTLGYGAPISARLSGSVNLRRGEEKEAFAGFSVIERRTEEAGITLSYALSNEWSVGGGVGWQRASYPTTILRAQSPSAASYTATLTVGRRFGAVSVF